MNFTKYYVLPATIHAIKQLVHIYISAEVLTPKSWKLIKYTNKEVEMKLLFRFIKNKNEEYSFQTRLKKWKENSWKLCYILNILWAVKIRKA